MCSQRTRQCRRSVYYKDKWWDGRFHDVSRWPGGGNDYEHGESSFTPWLSGNGGQPKNLKVGEATLTPMEKKKWTDRKQKHPLQRVSKRWKMYIKVVKNFIDRWHSRCCNKSEKRRRKKRQAPLPKLCVASQEFTRQWCHVHKQIMSISNMLNKSIMSGNSKWTVSTVTDRMPELWQDADVLQRGKKKWLPFYFVQLYINMKPLSFL